MIVVGSVRMDPPVLLAPMAAVTDLPFRTVCEELGAGLTVTEFLSANALTAGAEKALAKLEPSLGGRPFAVQIFGRDEQTMAQAAEIAASAGAHIVDINMGCPAKRVVAGYCGSALMQEPELAQRLVRAVRRAVPPSIPVTVKHRAGWDDRHRNAPEFACALVEAGARMITVHGRTRTQGFSGRSDLEIIAAVRRAVPADVPVIGNGDVASPEAYRRMRDETGCDGVMIGRGAMGNPWLFRSLAALHRGEPDPGPPSVAERLAVTRRHVALVLEHAPLRRRAAELRKVCAWYSRGQRGGAIVRERTQAMREPEAILAEIEAYFGGLCAGGSVGAGPPPEAPTASAA